MHFVLKKNENAKHKVLLLEVQVLNSRKFKNSCVGEVEQKYMTAVQGENNEKFNYYKDCISNENKSIEN